MRFGTCIVLFALLTAGCEQTADEDTPGINADLAVQVTRAALMVASLGTEFGVVADAPDTSFGLCPQVEEDGDDLILDYSGGCAPSTGTTSDEISGLLELTTPATNNVFWGSASAVGFPNLPVSGTFTAATSRTGDTVDIDLQLDTISWTEDGLDVVLTGEFTLVHELELTTIDLYGGELQLGTAESATLTLNDVTVPAGGLGACALPSSGTADLQRGTEEAEVTFSDATAEDGSVAVLIDETEASTALPCLGE